MEGRGLDMESEVLEQEWLLSRVVMEVMLALGVYTRLAGASRCDRDS